MSETKHTKTPWKRSKYGKVCGPDGKTIALRGFSLACGGYDSQPDIDDDFVFRAVNAYDADQAKIAALVDALRHLDRTAYDWLPGYRNLSSRQKALDALALAESGQ